MKCLFFVNSLMMNKMGINLKSTSFLYLASNICKKGCKRHLGHFQLTPFFTPRK